MGCCGQKRAALTSATAAAVTRPSQSQPAAISQPPIAGQQVAVHTKSAQPLPANTSVALRYTQTSSILVRARLAGANTGSRIQTLSRHWTDAMLRRYCAPPSFSETDSVA
jgi:hypothetical protein